MLVVSSVAVCALVSVSGAVAQGGPSAARSSAAKAKVYIAFKNCSGSQYKPAKVVLACADGNLYATNLRYSSYGSSSASAKGKIHANACNPNCAAGKFQTTAATLSFSRAVRCKDQRIYFTRAKYKYGKHSGTADIEPIGCKKKP